MFIVTPDPPEVGTELVLHFALPDSDPLEGTARVVWVRGPGEDHPYPAGMAVQFLDLPPDAQPAIAACVTKLLTTPTSSALS
jgi:Tfp pilus assembly protein PilZ